MARVIGIFACTTLVAVTLWMANSGDSVKRIRAQEGDYAPGAGVELSARDYLKQGKQHYLNGRYDEAVQALEAAAKASGELTLYEKTDLRNYLGRARMEANRQAGGLDLQLAAANDELGRESYMIARQMLDEARGYAKRGDLVRATQLAQRAKVFNAPFPPGEMTPDQFLSELQRGYPPHMQESQPQTQLAGGERPAQNTAPLPPAGNEAESPFRPAREFAPAEEFVESAPAAPPAQDMRAPSKSKKEQAVELVALANEALKARQYEKARQLALQATELNVSWGLFEPRPEQVLADVAQATATTTLIGRSSQPEKTAANSETAPSADRSLPPAGSYEKERALALLGEARRALQSGNVNAARSKVEEAAQLEVVYGLFDDRPELVLNEINAYVNSMNLAQQPSAEPKAPSTGAVAARPTPLDSGRRSGEMEAAQQLLLQARRALNDGDFEAARAKAMQAAEYDLAYGLFDDRPELVLKAVQNAERANALPKNDTLLAEKPQQNPFVKPSDDNRPQPSVDAASDDLQLTNKERAARLLKEARVALQERRFDDAEKKALEAAKLEATYGVFEDRPELVLNDLSRLTNKNGKNVLPLPVASTGAAPAPSQATPSEPPTADSTSDRRKAELLLIQARNDLRAGRFDEARRAAEEAQELNVVYGVFDDRPDIVLAEIDRILSTPDQNDASPQIASSSQTPSSAPVEENPFAASSVESAAYNPNPAEQVGPSKAANVDYRTPSGRSPAEEIVPVSDVAVIHPSGLSAHELYNQGIEHLRRGDRDAAYQAFLEAHQTGQKLDGFRGQQLQDFLRELAPRRQQNIQLTSGETGARKLPADAAPREFDLVEQQQAVKFDRLRSETLNAIFRSERLREKNAQQSMDILDRAMATVESSDLPEDMLAPLLRQLNNSRQSLSAYMKQREPIIALQQRNEEVKERIKQERQHEIRVEQEVATLVEEYNQLFKQRRYAEAELKAKQAEQLDPSNPVVVTMKYKAQLARKIDSNDRLREAKAESFWQQLDNVEWAAVNPLGSDESIAFPDAKTWKELTDRRSRYGRADNRTRSEEELRIEKSLGRQISLHFDKAPLSEVMKHIATVADVNVVLDNLGLEEEGVNSDTPVSIDVHGIMLKSALNLLLKPMNLDYTIEDEVLKVTSRMRQQGQLIVATYPVSDLVVPIPNFTPSGGTGMTSDGIGMSGFGTVNGGNMSVPSFGGMQQPAGAQFQVNDSMNGSPVGGWGAPGIQARLGGASSTFDFDTLSELIVSTVEPNSWEEVGGPGSIRNFETTLSLVIRQTQKVHEEIRDLLEQLRRLQDLQVTIEVRFITVADRFFERIGVDFDFNVQDTIGDDTTALPFGTVIPGTGLPGAMQGAAMAGQAPMAGMGNAAAGMAMGGATAGAAGMAMNGSAGGIGGAAQAAAGQQMAGQAQGGMQMAGMQMMGMQQAGTGFFDPPNLRALTAQDDWPKGGTIVGLSAPGQFSPDLDIGFRQGSFDIGVPDFGGFNPDAGIQVGLAILTDIEAFFFIQAAQGDERSNLMFAPKVTLFNGQQATVQSTVQRPFVTSLIPTVGFFSVGFTPQITVLSEGVTLTVQAVISADRRFVRLTVVPSFTNITDVFTFSFVSGGGGQAGQGGGGAQAGPQGLGAGAGGINQGASGLGGFGAGGGGLQGFGGIGGIAGIGGGFGGGQGGFGGGQGGFGGGQGGFGGGQNQQGQVGAVGNITIQQPVFELVNVTTTVSVPDGGTVLLGGVKRLREGRNMAGVPILNKIPYISRLFKNTGVGRETESLMLMVTPRIIIQEEEEELLGIPQ